jgi:hypothetical protein
MNAPDPPPGGLRAVYAAGVAGRALPAARRARVEIRACAGVIAPGTVPPPVERALRARSGPPQPAVPAGTEVR